MDRSEFLKIIAVSTLGCGAITGLSSCASYRYVDGNRDGTQLKVSKDAFEEDSYVLVRNPVHAKPIFLLKESKESYAAYLLECTHKQCTVKPTGDTLTCPCHGSKYDQHGQVLQGPAEQRLPAFQVTTDGQTIFIELQKELT